MKETALASYFIEVAVSSSFTRLRVVRRVNRVHEIAKQKICYKHSVVSSSYLNHIVILITFKLL